jgi:hypothetical protein
VYAAGSVISVLGAATESMLLPLLLGKLSEVTKVSGSGWLVCSACLNGGIMESTRLSSEERGRAATSVHYTSLCDGLSCSGMARAVWIASMTYGR